MKAQQGTWTLIAPDGSKFTADSPLAVCAAEMRARKSAEEMFENLVDGLDVELAEDAAMVRDAYRYRWLRDTAHNNRMPHISQYPHQEFDVVEYPSYLKVGIDAAIDAAMRITAVGKSGSESK